MILEHSGWSQERGCFCDKYYIDPTRTDHEIHWKDGRICKQITPFESVTRDWNYDGDVYTEFGAMFEGRYSREWWTPHHLLGLVVDGEAEIPGITKI
jgi:hypothetical protein